MPKANRGGKPRLLARKAYLSHDYYVLVVWPDGGRQKIGTFANRNEAANWVQCSAKSWLARRNASPLAPA